VVVLCDHILCLLTEDNNNTIIMRPHIVFTDGRQQRQPNHNTTTSISIHNMWSHYDWVVVVVVRQLTQYVVLLLTHDNNDNPIIIRPHIVFTDGQQQRQPNHNGTSFSCCRPSVNTIWGRIMTGFIVVFFRQ
jgi:hypothetical protein